MCCYRGISNRAPGRVSRGSAGCPAPAPLFASFGTMRWEGARETKQHVSGSDVCSDEKSTPRTLSSAFVFKSTTHFPSPSVESGSPVFESRRTTSERSCNTNTHQRMASTRRTIVAVTAIAKSGNLLIAGVRNAGNGIARVEGAVETSDDRKVCLGNCEKDASTQTGERL